jgi:hypothetical protein
MVIRICRYNKMTFFFSPGRSSVSKVCVVHSPDWQAMLQR